MNSNNTDMVEERTSSTSFDLNVDTDELPLIRQIAYRLFASFFLYPDNARIVTFQAVAEELKTSHIWQGYPFSPTFGQLLMRLKDLKVNNEKPIVDEYNRLFLVKPQAPPHEFYYLDTEGQFRGWMSANLQAEYAAAGLTLSPTLNELPDHISVELEYMSYLCSQEALALESNADAKYQQVHEQQRTFLRDHLAQWFPKFRKRVIEAAPEHLYQIVIVAVFNFLLNELDGFNLRENGQL